MLNPVEQEVQISSTVPSSPATSTYTAGAATSTYTAGAATSTTGAYATSTFWQPAVLGVRSELLPKDGTTSASLLGHQNCKHPPHPLSHTQLLILLCLLSDRTRR